MSLLSNRAREEFGEKNLIIGISAMGAHIYKGRFPCGLGKPSQLNAKIRIIPISSDFASDFELELVTWTGYGLKAAEQIIPPIFFCQRKNDQINLLKMSQVYL